MIDESLRWLIANGRIKQAKAIILRACKANNKNFDGVVSVSGFREFELNYETKLQERTNSNIIIYLIFFFKFK